MATETLAQTINGRINAIARLNRLSHRDVARIIGRSSSYAFNHLKNNGEWTLSDIDNILQATGYTVKELFADRFDLKMPTDLKERDDA